jgi:hypothetical protein
MTDIKMVLQPEGRAAPMEDKGLQPEGQNQQPVKIFCAQRPVALALLEDLIIIAGAHNDVSNGKATDEQIKKLAGNTHLFLVDLGDHLMLDCGLNEKDIEEITKRVSAQLQGMKK